MAAFYGLGVKYAPIAIKFHISGIYGLASGKDFVEKNQGGYQKDEETK